jgi:hypothetical protein
MPGKRVQFDDETWRALDLLAHDRMMDFQELADEAFRDLLQKHGRPTDLKKLFEALSPIFRSRYSMILDLFSSSKLTKDRSITKQQQ